jgi:nucleoside-diphosphate-sugar epimerase
MNDLLITGASGFLGQAIIQELSIKSEWNIFAVVSGRRNVTFPENVRVFTADLTNYLDRETLFQKVNPQYMLHLAWDLSNKKFINSENNIIWLQSSLDLLRLFSRGGKRFLFSGSSSEYGYLRHVCKESDELLPSDLYGECKLAFERVLLRHASAIGIQSSSLRVFPVYGPGEENVVHAIPAAIDTLMRRREFICKAPNNKWDYIYINDAAKAIIKVLESEYVGPVNISSGIGITMKMIFESIAKCLGEEELLSFDNENIPGHSLIGDNSILRDCVGYKSFLTFQEGIKNTVSWWKEKMRSNGCY